MAGGDFRVQTGYCDSNWAREYHDLWYEEVKDSAELVPEQGQFFDHSVWEASDNTDEDD